MVIWMLRGGVGQCSEQCDGTNGDGFDVFCLKQSCLDLVVSSALKKQGRVTEGSEMERNKKAEGKEPAPTREKQANPGGAFGIFTLSSQLLLQLCFPWLSSAARLPLSSLPSLSNTLPAFSSLLCAKEYFPHSFAKLLVLSFRFLSQTWLLLGAYKILADHQAFGGGHVCSHVCALKEQGLFLA